MVENIFYFLLQSNSIFTCNPHHLSRTSVSGSCLIHFHRIILFFYSLSLFVMSRGLFFIHWGGYSSRFVGCSVRLRCNQVDSFFVKLSSKISCCFNFNLRLFLNTINILTIDIYLGKYFLYMQENIN